MKYSIIIFAFINMACLHAQPSYNIKENIDDQLFMRYGEKKILACEESTVYFTTGSSIGKIKNNNHLEAKYIAGNNNTAKEPVLQTFVTKEHVIRLSFSNGKVIKHSFSKDSLTLLKSEIIADYAHSEEIIPFKFLARSSQNTAFSAIAIMITDRYGKATSLHLLTFDEEINVWTEHEIACEFNEKFINMHNLSVDNSGKAILCLSSKHNHKENADEKLELAIADQKSQVKRFSIPLNKNHLIDYTAQCSFEGDILIAGYFGDFQEERNFSYATNISRISSPAATSTFTLTINPNTKRISDINILHFPEEYLLVLPSILTSWQMFKSSVRAKEIVFVNDDVAYLVGYEYMLVTSSNVTGNRLSSQYFRNAIVTKIDFEGIPEKLHFIEMSVNANHKDVAETPAFYPIVDNENLHLFYIDNISNYKKSGYRFSQLLPVTSRRGKKEACLFATITPEGSVNKQFIYNNTQQYAGCLLIGSLCYDMKNKTVRGFTQRKWLPNGEKAVIEISLP